MTGCARSVAEHNLTAHQHGEGQTMPNFTRCGVFVGAWLILAGITVTALCATTDSLDGRIVGAVLLIGGTMSILTDRICREIRKTNRPADVAWADGYEIGHDKGWREGFAAAQPDATVTRLGASRAVDGATA